MQLEITAFSKPANMPKWFTWYDIAPEQPGNLATSLNLTLLDEIYAADGRRGLWDIGDGMCGQPAWCNGALVTAMYAGRTRYGAGRGEPATIAAIAVWLLDASADDWRDVVDALAAEGTVLSIVQPGKAFVVSKNLGGLTPKSAAKKPTKIAPYSPAIAPAPEATPKASARGSATTAAVTPP